MARLGGARADASTPIDLRGEHVRDRPIMAGDPLNLIADAQRDVAEATLRAAIGQAAVLDVTPISGGASGAALYRIEAAGRRPLLLRVDGPESPLLRRNPHRYTCLIAAAEAGIAPPVHHVDAAAGVAVTDFIAQQPLSAFPGGGAALAQALGELVGRLQASTTFPPLIDYRDLLEDMLGKVHASRAFADGLLDDHLAQLADLRARYNWREDTARSSHNDPNPGNVLFDGRRLWLIDWESAYRNDPLIDLAILADGLAPTPELTERLLAGWLGRPPDPALREKLNLTRRMTRLYYACFLINAAASAGHPLLESEIDAPDAETIERDVASDELAPGGAKAIHLLGRMYLEGFRSGRLDPRQQAAADAVTGRP
ncbi:MAG: hypothetical protein C0481_04285 [Phenylobacterium sp.]|uniref:phosphotransferase n=1 Tax=Phenylobacterium sp. TaxID=1871053 RepID=UPI0025F89D8C|nr:phosphotransferase [Phenylobacterium sp.]MBA4011064.1 hypothetical protein [Phenylobacterium sp.]